MNPDWEAAARQVIERCRALALFSDEAGWITRTYLSPPMHDVHRALKEWLTPCGCTVTIDAAGNFRAVRGEGPRIAIGSHLDTVVHAGAFDGILGVLVGVALMEAVPGSVELIGFSEEEGVRYGVPFLGSRAVTGELEEDMVSRMSGAIREFGLDPADLPQARLDAAVKGYLEFHIEQGPVLEQLGLPVGIVDAIAGQTRLEIRFEGDAAHAGTTPANLRRDALAGAAEWIGAVERVMRKTPGLVATVGRLMVEPGAPNVIAGSACATLDIRHAMDAVRRSATKRLVEAAESMGRERELRVCVQTLSDRAATPMDAGLTELLEHAVRVAGHKVHRMSSGAGHDAMIMAAHVPSAMLFVQSPGGRSHCPEESVREQDVAAALACGAEFLRAWERQHD